MLAKTARCACMYGIEVFHDGLRNNEIALKKLHPQGCSLNVNSAYAIKIYYNSFSLLLYMYRATLSACGINDGDVLQVWRNFLVLQDALARDTFTWSQDVRWQM